MRHTVDSSTNRKAFPKLVNSRHLLLELEMVHRTIQLFTQEEQGLADWPSHPLSVEYEVSDKVEVLSLVVIQNSC